MVYVVSFVLIDQRWVFFLNFSWHKIFSAILLPKMYSKQTILKPLRHWWRKARHSETELAKGWSRLQNLIPEAPMEKSQTQKAVKGSRAWKTKGLSYGGSWSKATGHLIQEWSKEKRLAKRERTGKDGMKTAEVAASSSACCWGEELES